MTKPVQAIRHPRRSLERGVRLVSKTVEPSPEHQPRDVWHWTSPKYRIRAVILLLINAALFAGLGWFAFWLRTGEHPPFDSGQYWERWWSVFDPTSPEQVTLLDFLLFPIPVTEVPMMAIIVGLVLASLTAIPILVSMLYRFPFALLFTAIIGFVAVLPWLAIMVTLCCLLARWRRVQFSFRLATALLSLLPLISYYALATRGVSASVHLSPLELGRLHVPWVLALIGACLLMAVVLVIARLVNYRPGAIAPLMSITFAVPVILFELYVGKDELYYRLLQHHFGPSSKTHFVDQLAAADLFERVARQRLPEQEETPEALQAIMEQIRLELQMRALGKGSSSEVLRRLNEDLATQQYEAVQAAERFRQRFHKSRYLANALYLQGQALDTRLAQEATLFHNSLVLRHYQSFPNAASRSAWQELRERFPTSPLATVARLRLAMLEGREGRFDTAIQYLDEIISQHSQGGPATTQATGWSAVLAKRPASSTLEVNQDEIVLEARKLQSLIIENRDPQQNDLALRRLLSLDPNHPMYESNLRELLEAIPQRFPLTRLRDNVEVLLAAAHPSRSMKITQLITVIEQLSREPESDALPRAQLELGIAYQDDSRTEEARSVLEHLRSSHPDTVWAAEAGRRLAAMGVAAKAAG